MSTLDPPPPPNVDWSRHERGIARSSFVTHDLHHVGDNRIELRPNGSAKAFALLFGILGSVGLYFSLRSLSGDGAAMGVITALPCGSVVFALIVWVGRGGAPIVFDRREGKVWRGRGAAPKARSRFARGVRSLGDVCGVQILAKSDDEEFQTYELNLVFDPGRRMQLVDHGGLSRMRVQADEIARFLDVPLWERTNRLAPRGHH